MMTIDDVVAKQEIAELHYRYARGIDTQDWAMFRSVFDATVVGDFSKWGMGSRMQLPGDAFTDLVRFLFSTEGLVTQHYMTNSLVEVDGDIAHGDTYVSARHKLSEEVMSLNAVYTCDYVHGAEGWRISSITMTPTWDEGGDVIKFFQLPDPAPTGKHYLFVTAPPVLAEHAALERYVGGVVPMLMQAGGSQPMIIKQDESVIGHTDTFMSMIVTFDNAESAHAGRAVFDSDAYAALVPDRDTAFSQMNIAFYSDMPHT